MGSSASGRKKQPVQLAKLKGTYQPCRHRGVGDDGGEKVTSLQMCYGTGLYKSLPKRAREVYLTVCRELLPLKMLTRVDLSQLALYAHEWDIYLDCTADIEKNGRYTLKYDPDGKVAGTVENPSVRHRVKALDAIIKIGQNFGLSPVDRQRIKSQAAGEDPRTQIINLVMNGDGYTADEQ